MQENELLDDKNNFEAFMKNASPYATSSNMEALIMSRIHKLETQKRKSAHYFKTGRTLLITASGLYLILNSLDTSLLPAEISAPWLFESICIISFLFLFDKILTATHRFH